jgi:DNA-binding transcriptional regulator YhcF (GntR family)
VQQFFLGGRYPSADDILRDSSNARNDERAAENPAIFEQIKETIGDAVAKTKLRVGLNLLKDAGIVKEKRGAKFSLAKTDLSARKSKKSPTNTSSAAKPTVKSSKK